MGLLSSGAALFLACAVGACLTEPKPFDGATDGAPPRFDAIANDGALNTDSGPNDPDAVMNDAVVSPNTHSAHFTLADDHHFFATDASRLLNVVDTMTFEAWIKLDTLPSPGDKVAIAVKANNDAFDNSYGFEIRNAGGVYRLEARVEGFRASNAAFDAEGWNWAIAVATWYHVAVTYDITPVDVLDRFRFFINGQEVLEQLPDPLMDGRIDTIRQSSAPLIIGARFGAVAASNQFDGRIDEVRIWNLVRTDFDIAATYNTELTGADAGLVGYWQLDDSLVDGTANGNTLEVFGAPGPEFVTDHPTF